VVSATVLRQVPLWKSTNNKEMDTMKTLSLVALILAVALFAGVAVAEKAAITSGPQVGEDLAGPFHPLNVNGSAAGKKNCLYCSNGSNPVAMVFAREASPELTKLIKKLDSCVGKHADAKMGSFVVFCSNEEGLETKLKDIVKENEIKKVVLSIDNPAGPEGYKVSKDADVTVVLYKNRNVKANYAFKKGELKDKDIDKIVKDLSKILPSD
jgi:hypothetical protein